MNTYYSVQNIESTNHWIYPLFICLGGIALLIIYQLVKKKKLFKNTTSQVSQNVGRIVFPCVIIGGFIGTVVMFVSGIVEDSRSRDSLNKQRFHVAAGRMKNCFYQDQRNSTTISFEVQDVEFVIESYNQSFTGLHKISQSDFSMLQSKIVKISYIYKYDQIIILKLEYI